MLPSLSLVSLMAPPIIPLAMGTAVVKGVRVTTRALMANRMGDGSCYDLVGVIVEKGEPRRRRVC